MRQKTLFGGDTPEESGATLSDCGLFRYALWRRWGEGRVVNFIMLNPSTADARADDPTVRRCVGYARAWGFARLDVTNLYALRATDPAELWRADDPVGPQNDDFLRTFAVRADLVVCAWGNHGAPGGGGGHAKQGRGPAVRAMLVGAGVRPHRLSQTGLDQPGHPLYLPASLWPTHWEDAR